MFSFSEATEIPPSIAAQILPGATAISQPFPRKQPKSSQIGSLRSQAFASAQLRGTLLKRGLGAAGPMPFSVSQTTDHPSIASGKFMSAAELYATVDPPAGAYGPPAPQAPKMIIRANPSLQERKRPKAKLNLTSSLARSLLTRPAAEAKMSNALKKNQFQIEDNRRVGKTLSEPVTEGQEQAYLPPSSHLTREAGDAGAGQDGRPESQESLERLLAGLHPGEATGLVDPQESADGEVNIGEQPFHGDAAEGIHTPAADAEQHATAEDGQTAEAEGVSNQGSGSLDLLPAPRDGSADKAIEEDQMDGTASKKTNLVLPSDLGSPEGLPPSQSRSSTLAEAISDRLHNILQNIELDEVDRMDQDELNARLFDRYTAIHHHIGVNVRAHGYAKSPDFRFKQEKLQRLK